MRTNSSTIIDAAGATAVTAIIGAAGWFALLKPDTASSQLDALSAEVLQLHADLDRLQTEVDGHAAKRRALLASAESLGRLPTKSPIDQDLQRITSLATAHDVQVLEVSPVSTVKYPNVLESRYSIKARGGFADYMRFLGEFENCAFWADVTYVNFLEVSQAESAMHKGRSTELTVSFYSAFQ